MDQSNLSGISNLYFPFTLLIDKISAKNLTFPKSNQSISELGNTMDPYVTLTIGETSVGQTKEIYRNNNPHWDGLFSVQLLHVHNILSFRIYDKNSMIKDILLGTVVLDLKTLTINETLSCVKQLTHESKNIELDSNLSFTVKLTKETSVVHIERLNENSTMNAFQKMICEEAESIKVSEPVKKFILQNSSSFFIYLHQGFIQDLFYDVHCLGRKCSQDQENIILPKENIRNMHLNLTSTRMDLFSNSSFVLPPFCSVLLNAPFLDYCIHFIFINNDQHENSNDIILYGFGNKLCLWIWIRWFRFLHKYWHLEEKEDSSIPNWITEAGER